MDLPATGGLVLTGRLSLAAQPWLAGHVIAGQVLVPGAAIAEMVVRAADEAGCGRVEELVIEVPLVVPARGGVRVQVTVEAADEAGRRGVSVFAQREDAGPDAPWTRHAAGDAGTAGRLRRGRWRRGCRRWRSGRRPGRCEQDLAGFYPALARPGWATGRCSGRAAAWRRGEEFFAEVALPEGTPVAGFGVHPALLDAALHVIGLGAASSAGPVLPFAWADVAVHAAGAAAARVRVAPAAAGEGVSVTLADGAGALVASVRVAGAAGAARRRARAAGRRLREALFRVEWVPA